MPHIIKLTRKSNGNSVMINSDKIMTIEETKKGGDFSHSVILFDNEKSIRVSENQEVIKELIDDVIIDVGRHYR